MEPVMTPTRLDPKVEQEEEYVGEEDLDLSQLLFLNDSSPVVSRKWTSRTNERNF